MGGAGPKKKKIVVDIDGVLCENTRVHYHLKLPYSKAISCLDGLFYKGYKIILFTSRKSRYRKQTLWWLRNNNVKYHKLVMNKPKGDLYIDDKSIFYNKNWVKRVK